jgi:hypothetical protein
MPPHCGFDRRTPGKGGDPCLGRRERRGLHDLSFLPALPISALLAVVFEVMLNRPGVT